MLVVTDPHHLPASYIKYPQSKIWAVGDGWGETKKKGFLHLIIRDSQKQNDNNKTKQNKTRLLLWCFSFHNILPPEVATFQEWWKKSSLLFVTSVCKANLRTAHTVKGLKKFGITVSL